jgi:hypothetical protein
MSNVKYSDLIIIEIVTYIDSIYIYSIIYKDNKKVNQRLIEPDLEIGSYSFNPKM